MATPIPLLQKVFYAAVGLLAVYVGFWGYLIPTQIDQAIPWLVPPLHARFLGAMYLSGATMMAGAILARYWSSIRVVVVMISVWTGWLLIVSFFYIPSFSPYLRLGVFIWWGAYIMYPLVAAWIAWQMRAHTETGGTLMLPAGLRIYLIIQGTILIGLAIFLFVFPSIVVQVWPWKISPMLAQIYSAPFLSYGVGSLYATRQKTYADVQLVLVGLLVFAGLVLLASVIHLTTFSTGTVATWLWFAGFAIATLFLAVWNALPFFARLRQPGGWQPAEGAKP